ncbi:ectonucleoside triphosphate diphosphohydrolase 1-like isoform X2 [Mizuhopecten yessoensis]|uniref:ectonucleoside triphosphate diphosphohydrolase 1-like isoform X2 n=1 Tax=Mizuhopecten yessoensis TaxID=6573 RepID=UPI000B458F5D|nr:ectonucleoside triphosphate diphosphohydrolase 1-like isoform X2 [Mizuhopecten yessoensis]
MRELFCPVIGFLLVFVHLSYSAPTNETLSSNDTDVETNTTDNGYDVDMKYGVILDAGSTSTKVHVYSWKRKNHETAVPQITEVQYRKYRPGVGAYAHPEHEMGGYLTPIFDFLTSNVPAQAHNATPVMFMATAGLRLLSESAAQSILHGVHSIMSNSSLNPFLYEERFVRILSGEEEGFLAWISANYLRGFFTNQRPQESIGVIEVGGGSCQIAFIPEVPIYEDKIPVQIGGLTYEVYTHSFLSYGAQTMTSRIRNHLVRRNQHAIALVDPCMLKDDTYNLTNNEKTVRMVGGSNASECQSVLRHYLARVPEYMCSPKPCTIGSVYGPPVGNRTFIAMGVIYNTAKELGLLKDGDIKLVPSEMEAKAKEFCKLRLSEASGQYGIKEKWASSDCQNGLYVPMLLEALGFKPNTAAIQTKTNAGGIKIGWSLGAMLQEEERQYHSDVI